MRKPSLTFDTFVAALAVLGVSASAGCSKAGSASAEPVPPPAAAPEASGVATGSPPALAPGPTTTAAASAAPDPLPKVAAPEPAKPAKPEKNAVTVTPVEGSNRPLARKKGDADGGAMTCGAGMCSADMKKGN